MTQHGGIFTKIIIGLTYFLTTLLSSVVHDDWWVDERASIGYILSQQAFHFMGPQTDGQIKELHRSIDEETVAWITVFFHKYSRFKVP